MVKVPAELFEALAAMDDALASALHDDLATVPSMPASNEGLEAAFFLSAYRYGRAWLTKRGGTVAGAKPCVLVLSRAIKQDAQTHGATLCDYFMSALEKDYGGSVLVGDHRLSKVASLPADEISDLASIGGVLEQTGLADSAHVVFRPDQGDLLLRQAGPFGMDAPVSIEINAPLQLSLAELEARVWAFHQKFTQTPSGILNCWRGSPADRITAEELERSISGLLAFVLGTVVGEDHVDMEHYTSHGRADIAIRRTGMAKGIGPCVLELKVLRSRRWSSKKGWTSVSDKEMVDHASHGVVQAADYRAELKGEHAYLCCFDARLEDIDQPAIVALAAQSKIELRRYFLYENEPACRNAKLAAMAAGTRLSGEPPLVAS